MVPHPGGLGRKQSGFVIPSSECVACPWLARKFAIMNEPRRFEFVLPAELRGRLFALAGEIGTGAADLARLAILRLVNEGAALTADRRGRFAVEQPQISQWEGPQTGADSGDEVLAEVRDLSELHRALRQRSEALNLSRNGLDALAGLETGYSAKVLAQRPARCLGPVSLPALLGALGCKLLLVVDDRAMARLEPRLADVRRKRSRHLPDVSPASPAPASVSTHQAA